ncbi:dTDP-4-dehydrorhamnose reductase [Corynebacterium aquilae]|uniref:dTDP-4-dehydrorhamnose reductase n=1 Tax=Corynebacterium aquilae DSM 44791 TaxID=1431546 RepID=A0A1L7CEB1_9CORY|nr:dTDP-4-dehydrorhamnose reductase [Corynebacterium aquilae]APT84181.1 hypothetical protein CAQU_02830 [Corynebacterium aquilae DSM 44791]
MRLVITGKNGQLGSALRMLLDQEGLAEHYGVTHVDYLGREDLDLTDKKQVLDHPIFSQMDSDTVLLNAAAFTAVDHAETDPAAALAGNEDIPANLAAVCATTGAFLIHVSTDYVFPAGSPGHRTSPWQAHDQIGPSSLYGESKARGERAVRASGARAAIARTAWVYSGDTLPEHKDFVSTMAAKARAGQPAIVVDDQVGSPTYAIDLAHGLLMLAHQPQPGTVHIVGSGQASWYELARAVYDALGANPDELIKPVPSHAYSQLAIRPQYSVLGTDTWRAAGHPDLPHWTHGLKRALAGDSQVHLEGK